MDVTCERCKAEYEFDEALLGEKGTTVKCSACGHVFRVMPPNRDLGRSHLKLRYAKDGTVQALASLRELQQRIRAGEVSFDDELGRDGFPFRPLREVPELKNFFSSALDKTAVRPDAARLGDLSVAEQTVVKGMPGGSAGATLGGLAASPSSMPPPLPGGRGSVLRDDAAHESEARETEAARATAAHFAAREAAAREAQARDAEAARAAAAAALPPHEAVQVHQTVPASWTPQRAGGPVQTPSARPPAGGSPSDLPEPKLPPESRARGFTKQTMMGVGPEALNLPPPPRVPSFAASPPPEQTANVPPSEDKRGANTPAPVRGAYTRTHQPQASDASGTRPYQSVVPASPHATLLGTPTAARTPTQAPPAPRDAPTDASASHGRGGTLAPVYGVPVSDEDAERDSQGELVSPDEVPGSPAFGYTSVDDLVERLEDDQAAPVLDIPDENRRLYLDANERAPKRVDEGGSKLWTYALVAVVLLGGGWFAWQELEDAQLDDAVAAEPSYMPSEAVDAAPEPELAASADEQADPQAEGSDEALPDSALEERAGTSLSAVRQAADAGQLALALPVAAASPVSASNARPDAGVVMGQVVARAVPPPKPALSKPEPNERADKPVPASKPLPVDKPAATNPEDYGGLVKKGDQLFARGDFDGAQKAYQAALSARAAGSEANAGLGYALLGSGKAREALPYFDRAASSGYAEASIGLGDTYRKLGQPSSAIEAYQQYLERLSKGSRADYARAQIDKLKGGSSDKSSEPSTPWNGGGGSTPGTNGYRPAGELTAPGAATQPSER